MLFRRVLKFEYELCDILFVCNKSLAGFDSGLLIELYKKQKMRINYVGLIRRTYCLVVLTIKLIFNYKLVK